MSATASTARYVIAADDKTKAAVASVISGFRSMERNIKGAVSRINLGLSLIGGVALKRALQNVFTETAKQSKEFASALDDVKHSARNLLAAKEGAPAATAAMRELAEVLKDPEVVKAADAIASVFIRGAAGAVKFATGVKTLKQEIEELEKRRDQVAKGGDNSKRTFIKGEPTFAIDKSQEVLRINAELLQKQKQLREQDIALAIDEEATWDRLNAAADKASRRFSTMGDFEQNIKYLEEIEKKLKDGAAGDKEFFQQLSREGDVSQAKSGAEFFEQMDKAAQDVGETLSQTGDSIDQVGDAIGRAIGVTDEWSVAADEAARNMQDAFANFLFDPFEDGLRGMLKGFIDIVRRMVAEAASAQIFEAFGGVKGVGGFLSGLFGSSGGSTGGVPLNSFLDAFSVPAYADGTDYVPHDQLAMVHQGERIVPAKFNKGSGGGDIHINMPIDARGATEEGVKRLEARMPAIIRQAADLAKAELRDERRRGKPS